MSAPLIERFVRAARQETARSLQELCAEVGAAEASVLAPSGAKLIFFASTNPLLMSESAPSVPINGSFSGAAFRSGQTMAVANAAGMAQHYGAVDATTKEATHEFAAIPIAGREVLGVLTLVNRLTPSERRPAPFSLDELARAEAFARETGLALQGFPGLFDHIAGRSGHEMADASWLAPLANLGAAERRVVAALADALIKNRGR
ncbi:MAG: GAF domain-containing protein [Roseiarcus sp.]|jgi:hypothetical protein